MEERALRKTRTGLVTSDKMDKSITIAIIRRVPHPVYKKYSKKTTKLMAHDEGH
jgi:small subunit ribosomal protein S17